MKMQFKSKWVWILVTIIIILLALWLGEWLSREQITSHVASGTNDHQMQLAKNKPGKPLYWVAPMNPKYRRNKPGKSPMGMDLVPVYTQSMQEGTIRIASAVENNLGVRTAIVKKQNVPIQIRTVGYVQPNERSLQTISVYTKGWIKNLKVSAAGDPVTKGQLLFKIYSPSLVSAQEEYLLALKNNNSLITKAGRQKLVTLGMTKKDIKVLMVTRQVKQNIPVYAPQSGYVTKLKVREGTYVMPGTPILSIANLATVWVIAEVYERQSNLLKIGQSAQARFSSLPGNAVVGKVAYIYPELNIKTRTVRVRLIFTNFEKKLKPGMYANVTINAGAGKTVIAIPKEALIQLGDSNRVVLSLGNGKFKPVTVKIGRQNQDWVQISQGLKPGDRVVTSAQFLLDSESSLKSGLSRMSSEESTNSSDDHSRH
ncbi:MAG: efflux transporter periplasmic adaptor subunit [Coxiella sp. (in: Bacteria)]|nr:MAG: efflux transporter periplasmic adaptor subunit [Coxiella sp. (in: g-proteobacteria)]